MMQIIVKREGEEHGPYTIDEITEYLASGNIVGDDAARADGTTEWKTVNTLVAQARAKELTDKAVAGAKALAAKGSEAALVGIKSLAAKGSEAAVTGFVMATDPNTGVKARYSRLSPKQKKVVGAVLVVFVASALFLMNKNSSERAEAIARADASARHEASLPMGLRIAHNLQRHDDMRCVQFGQNLEDIYNSYGDSPTSDQLAGPILEMAVQMCGRAQR